MRVEKSSKEVTVGASIEAREGIDKSSGNTTSGASYTTLDSISECDHTELHTGNCRDPLPLRSPMDTAMAKKKDRVFPPISQVIPIAASLLVTMFLVALVWP